MNREILFKAKIKNWWELPKEEWWVEGYYVYCRKRHYILPVLNKTIGFDEREDEWIEIDPDTLCPYTSLTDKNDRKIWENDIVEIASEDGYFLCEWDDDAARYVLNGYGLTVDFDNYWAYEVEVVGNIFDNADLLEMEEDI